MNNLIDVLMAYYQNDIKKDVYHKIVGYILSQFQNLESLEAKNISKACNTTVATVQKLAFFLGYETFQELKKDLVFHKDVKLKQVSKRLENTDFGSLYEIYKISFKNENCLDQDALKNQLMDFVELIKNSKRFFVYGAIYPRALLLNNCFDLILKDKVVTNYEDLNKEEKEKMTQDDLIIVISYTGTFIALKTKEFLDICQLPCKKLIVSQYTNYIDQNIPCEYHFLQLPYHVDSYELNYILLSIFDMIKYLYYKS